MPRVDPYTFTVPGARWIDIHWLHQVGLHGLHALGGHGAVGVAKMVLASALVVLLAPIGARRERPVLSALFLALMLLVAGDRFMPRPELPSFLLLAGVLLLLDRFERRGGAAVHGVPVLVLIWANLHGLFALGIAMTAIHGVAELLRPAVSPGARLRPARLLHLAAATGLAALASLANPNGLDGALYPIQQLSMIGPPEERGIFGTVIAELIPPFAGGVRGVRPVLRACFLALAALSFAAMAANWRRLRAADPLLWVAFLYLALGAQRNLALFALVAAPLAVRNANEALDAWPGGGALRRRARRIRGPGRAAAAAALLALTGLAVAGRLFPLLGSYREPGFGVTEVLHPLGAAEWIARERPPGPICHHMADGGFLIWRLYPDYPVMADGRLEVFGARRFAELQVTGPDAFRRLDGEYRFGAVLVHYSLVQSEQLLWWLYLHPSWKLVFVDEVAALFVRPREGEWFPEVDPDAPDLFPPLAEARGPGDMIRRMARSSFHAALRRHERALELWRDLLAHYPDLPRGRLVEASLLHRSGFAAAAEAIVRALLADDPDDPLLHLHVGDLRLESGDPEAAKQLYDRALALDPSSPRALYRRGLLAEGQGDAPLAVQLYSRAVARSHPAHPAHALSAQRLRGLVGGSPGG